MNFLLIVGDSLRVDRASDRGLMPRLNEFVEKRCTRFTRAYTTAPWTLASHNGILWGRMPSEVGTDDIGRSSFEDIISRDRNFLLPKIEMEAGWLPFYLKKAGYFLRWRGGGGYFSGAFGFTREFHLADQWEWVYLDPVELEKNLEELRRLGQKWFFYSQDFDTHESFGDWPRENSSRDAARVKENQYRTSGIPGMVSEEEKRQTIFWYDDSCRKYDAKLGRLFDYFEWSGLLEDTMIFLTSDHGEELWEHGFGGHGMSLHESAVRVPLAVHFPGRGPGVHDGVVSLMDVASTIFPGGPYAGEDLRAPAREVAKIEMVCRKRLVDSRPIPLEPLRRVLSMTAWVSKREKIILQENLNRRISVLRYDLEEDAGEMFPEVFGEGGKKIL